MSSAYNLPNYKDRYFQYKELDKIHGQPTIDSILTLLRQVKRNAQTVPTTRGGGQLGYLALVIDTASYNAIPGATAFTRPTDPGTFVVTQPLGVRAVPLTPTDIATQKIVFDESMRQYNECQAVEVALRNQIIEVIEDEYLRPLRNTTTDMINSPIQDIFTFLITTYGNLSPAQLRQREQVIDNFTYDPTQNVDTIFNKIQEFQDLCVLLSNRKTDTQLVTYAYLCFQKVGIFQNSLLRWNAKLVADKTFALFKIFMRKEYLDLDAVGGLTVESSSLNLIRELQSIQKNFASNLKSEIQEGLVETLQAFNLTSYNQENIDPNTQYALPLL